MGRRRKPLTMSTEGATSVCYFLHPFRKNDDGKPLTVRANLGPNGKYYPHLNRVFMNPAFWYNLPEDFPPALRTLWLGELKPTDSAAKENLIRQLEESASDGEQLTLEAVELLTAQHAEEVRKLKAEITHWKGRRMREGPVPSLIEARKNFLASLKATLDKQHREHIEYDTQRFVDAFGADTPADVFYGAEEKLDTWLAGLMCRFQKPKTPPPGWQPPEPRPLGPTTRNRIRTYALKMLDFAGILVDRHRVAAAGKREIRRARGPRRWVSKKQAEQLAKHLVEYWSDAWRVQVGIGLRPDELITLKESDFTKDLKVLTLSPLDIGDVHLTLKLGSRSIQVPSKTRTIIRRRLKAWPHGTGIKILFPFYSKRPDRTGGVQPRPWTDAQYFDKSYREALQAAALDAGIVVKMDCRIGRKTCANILLRDGMSPEAVARLLGDDLKTLLEHYAQIHSEEVNPKAAAI